MPRAWTTHAAALLASCGCAWLLANSPALAAPPARAVTAVGSVDLKKYMGLWYEVARLPNRYQDGLVGVTAEYQLRPDGKIAVTNRGRRGTLDGPVKTSTATGWVVDSVTNAKWHVQFVWPFKADYWVIDLCPQYGFAVVGQPCRSHLWILSREKKLDPARFRAICERTREQGYDPDKLLLTPQ